MERKYFAQIFGNELLSLLTPALPVLRSFLALPGVGLLSGLLLNSFIYSYWALCLMVNDDELSL